MATIPAYSDDKIVVDGSHPHNADVKSLSLQEQTNDKIVATHDEKLALDGSGAYTNEKMATTEAVNPPDAPDGKEVTPADGEHKVLAAETKAPQAAEKIPADDSISATAERTPTDTSWASQTRTTSRSYREYTFHHTSWKLNHNVIVDPNNQAMYFAENSGFTRSREDVVLHGVIGDTAAKGNSLTAEEGKACPSIAFAQFAHRNPDAVQLGLGRSDHMNSVKWFELTRSGEADDWRLVIPNGTGKLAFRLATTTNGAEIDPASPDTPTSHLPSDNRAPLGSFTLIDSGLGIALAKYTEQKAMSSWKKRGKLRLFDRGLSDIKSVSEQEMEQLVVLSCAVLNEKRRRKSVRKWTGIGMG